MMTKQAELKKQAYESNLKSRALSVLIYLIDRSNKDLTCFPAIPTMAEQLHISVSTVKRALHELVQAGFIKKNVRYREKNRGQTSNLYILLLRENVPEPETGGLPITAESADSVYHKVKNRETGSKETEQKSGKQETHIVEHINFADLMVKTIQEDKSMDLFLYQAETIIVDIVKEDGKSKLVKIGQGKKQFPIQSPRAMNMHCSNHECNLPKQTFLWTGEGVNLHSP